MKEEELAQQTPASLRLAQAEYFLGEYIRHCGPPVDSYFGMVCCFDAFLFAFVSVEEMVNEEMKKKLNEDSKFRFFKALRNITTHHSILSAPIDGKFLRPFSRSIEMSVGNTQNESSRLSLNFNVLREILDAVELERKQERYTIAYAREFLKEMEDTGNKVFIEDLMRNTLDSIKQMLANS